MKRNRLQEAEMAVLAVLKKGCANATTGGEIATITGYNSSLISSAISHLDIAETRAQRLEGLRSLENQVKNEQKRLDILKSIEDVTAYEKILERG